MESITIPAKRNGYINVLEVIGNAGIGGMENYLTNFISHLPGNLRITCICPYESLFTASLRQLGVANVYITPIEDDPAWRSIQLAIEIGRLHKIDVFHAHMPKAHVLAGLAGKLIHKPVVATVHGMNVTSQEIGITRAVESHLITNCQESYIQALAMGVPSNRVTLARNGVNTKVTYSDSAAAELRKSIKVPNNTPLIGFVGRFEYEKGPDFFLRAAEYVHRIRPDVHFVMVGEGSMRNEVEMMCMQMRLNRHVHFLGWKRNMAEIYPGLDILVHTSRSDGTSLVLLEAMTYGCPTVGLSVGGVREIIENESTGFLAGGGDWQEVGVRICELLKHPERLKKMSAAARARVEKHFNVETNTLKTVEVLQQVALNGVNGFANDRVLDLDINHRSAFENIKGRPARTKI